VDTFTLPPEVTQSGSNTPAAQPASPQSTQPTPQGQTSGDFTLPAAITAAGSDSNFTLPAQVSQTGQAVSNFDSTPDDKLVNGPFSPTQFYLDNKEALSPDQYNRLVNIYKQRQESGYTGSGAGSAAKGAVSGIEGMAKDAFSTMKEFSNSEIALDAAKLAKPGDSYWDIAKKVATEKGGEALSGVENMATDMGNLVRGGIRTAINQTIPRAEIQTVANIEGHPEVGQDMGDAVFGPRRNADVLDPKTMLQPTDWSLEFQRDASMQDQLGKTEQANGAYLKGLGLDPDTVSKEGITYDPAAIRTISFASNPLNYLPGLGGLKVAGTVIRDAAGNVIARAATEDAARAFVQKAQNAVAGAVKTTTGAAGKSLNVAGNVVGVPSDVAGTFVSNALKREGGRGILAGIGKTLDSASAAVKAQGPVGAATSYLTKPFSISDTVRNLTLGSADDLLAMFASHGTPVGSAILGSAIAKPILQLAGKGVAGVGELGAKAISSDAANALVRGAGTGAAYMAPIAATQQDPQDQMQSLFSGALFGAGGTSLGLGLNSTGALVRRAGVRAAQIFNSHVFKNLDSGNVEPTTLNIPGFENLEAATQKNVQSLGQGASKFNLLRALLNPDAAAGNTASPPKLNSQPLYLLTPEEMAGVDPKFANQDGVFNANIGGKNVTLVSLRNGKMPALDHEVAHSFVNQFAQTDPEGFASAVNSISPAAREQFKNSYLGRSGVQSLDPQTVARISSPDYQNHELMTEIFSRYLHGEALNLPMTAMQRLGLSAGNLLGSIGVDGTYMAEPGTPGASASMGVVPGFQAGKAARGAIQDMVRDPQVQAALKAVRVPPRLNASAKPSAAPATPAPSAPAAATPSAPVSPVTPAHQAVVDSLNAWHPSLGKKYQDVLDKVNRGETLTPTEERHWRDIQDNANPAPAATPAATPTPAAPATPAPALAVPTPAPAPAPTPAAPAENTPSISATPAENGPASIRNKPADFQKFTGATRQPATDRVNKVLEAVKNDTTLTPEQKKAATQLLSNLRTPHDVVYNAAKEISGKERTGRRADIEAARNNPDLRAVASKLASIPLDARISERSGPQVQMWSGDKVLANIDEAVKQISAKGQQKAIPYETREGNLTEAGMTELASDLQKYTENQDNGYRGDGKELVRPANPKGFIPDQNPDYKPRTISSQRADFLNLLMGEKPPTSTRATTGIVPIQARAKELATANQHEGTVIQPAKRYKEPYQDVVLSDYNPLRARLDKAGVDLSNLTEAHEWVNAKDIKSATPRPDIKLSPTATDVTAAGFLPEHESREIILTGPKGERIPASFDGYQDFSAIGKGKVAQITPHVDVPGVVPAHSTTYSSTLEQAGFKVPPTEHFMPSDEVRKVAEGYTKSAGIKYTPHTGYEPVNEARAKGIADFYQNAKHEPANPGVKKSYAAFTRETKAQYDYITSHGVKMEPWTKEGQPYKNSSEMTEDVRNNKHLWYFPSEGGFGQEAKNAAGHPLMESSGVKVAGKEVPFNDLFRAVHDYFGHAKEGYEFGPRGEYNAYLAHSRMYSEEARPAMAAETLGQNSWVNFGSHLRDKSGNLPKKGEPGFVPAPQRPFAEQKATVLPAELHSEQLMPTHDEGKERIVQAAMRTPDGKIFSGSAHIFAENNAEAAGVPDADIRRSEDGFLTSHGRFVNRDEAYQIANGTGQIKPEEYAAEDKWGELSGDRGTLESVAFNRTRQFMPAGGRDAIRPAKKSERAEINLRIPYWKQPGYQAPQGVDVNNIAAKYTRTPPRVNQPGKLTSWVLPNGEIKPLSTSTHEEDLAASHQDYNEKFGTSFGPKASESDRVPALNAGFVRIRNYNGRATVEANQDSWKTQGPIVEQHLLDHSGDIDHLTVKLLDDKGDEVSSAHTKLFDSETPDKDIQKTIASVEPAATSAADVRREPGLIQRARAIPGPAELGVPAFMPKKKEASESVKEAAIRLTGGQVYSGNWHKDAVKAAEDAGASSDAIDNADTGFVTSKGRFVNRIAASRVAVESGQMPKEWLGHELDAAMLKNSKGQTPQLMPKREGFVGQVDNYGEVSATKGDLRKLDHEKLGMSDRDDQTNWRYNPATKTVYWWHTDPDDEDWAPQKEAVEAWLSKKGYEVSNHVDVENRFNEAHGMVDPRFMPAAQDDLFGGPAKEDENDVRKMSPAALAKQFPEIIKPVLRPNGEKQPIPYNFSDAPLVKKFKTEDQKVNAYADALVNESRKYESTPEFQSGMHWYSSFVPQLHKWFGEHAPLFAELLAATSPRTNPTVNFGYAADALEGWVKGKYDKQISKYKEGLSKLNDGSLRDWYTSNVPKKSQRPKPSEGNMLGAWIAAHNLLPTRLSAAGEEKGFGLHSEAVLKVLTRSWMDQNQGVKVRQFVGNLTGKDNGATIDVWASRTLHRLGYDSAKRWRILPEQESPLPDPQFAFGQKVFAAAAKKMGVTPDALQGGMWFAEKKHWNDNGWADLNLGDYRAELEKFVHKRKLKAAQLGLNEDIIPVNRVQSFNPSGIKRASSPVADLFDIKSK
jgi:hypothetical protein